jgi:hypothetical protein
MIRSITVRQLRQLLFDVDDQEAIVVFSSDYGDHSHTEQVHAIRGEFEEVQIETSAYSQSGWAVINEDDDEADVNDAPTVIRIS